MDCERVRAEFVSLLSPAEANPWSEPVARHLEGCEGCRAELESLSRTWALLDRWPEAAPGAEIRTRLARGVRRQLVRESVLTVSGWAPAVLAAAIGVGLSLGLSLLVPYSFLVSLCRRALEVSELHAAPYLLAGAVYAIPLALGTRVLRKRVPSGALIGSLEASLLFVVILAPYVIARCREFAPILQIAFLSGLGVGAVLWSLTGVWFGRPAPFGGIQS